MVSSSKTLDLTYGIEVECFTALPSEFSNAYPSDLQYLAAAFLAKGLRLNPNPCGDKSDYSDFSITYDGSLSTEVITYDRARFLGLSVDEASTWREGGVELVSPPLPAPETSTTRHALAQPGAGTLLRDYVDALKRGNEHRSYVTERCGLHLHFGLSSGRHLPLQVLQHLAWLLLQYEVTISSLHHHSRTPHEGRQAAEYCRSNRTAFLIDGHTCHKDSNKILNMTMAKNRIFESGMTPFYLAGMMGSDEMLDDDGKEIPPIDYYSIQDVDEWEWRMRMREQECSWAGQTIAALNVICTGSPNKIPDKEQNLGLSTKYKITRWNLIERPHDVGPQTIEFRQPAGTLDTDEIGYTIQFYTALVRTAERLAAGTQVHTCEDAEEPNLEGLLRLLQLSEPVCEYWRSRAAKVAEQSRLAGLHEDLLRPAHKCRLCSRSDAGTYDSRKKFEKEFIDRAKAGKLWEKEHPVESDNERNTAWSEQEQEREREWTGYSDGLDASDWTSGLQVEGVQW